MSEKLQNNFLQAIIDRAQANVQSLLTEFSYSRDFLVDINTAFGGDFNRLSLEQFSQQWRAENFNDFPEVEIISSVDLNGANGAFSKDTNKIYLADEFLTANRLNINAATAVLLEEYGHYLDSQINSIDAPGDEGAIFVAVIDGEDLNVDELTILQAENDTFFLDVDSRNIQVEYSDYLNYALAQERILTLSGNYSEYYFVEGDDVPQNPYTRFLAVDTPIGGASETIESVWDEASENFISIGTYTAQNNYEPGIFAYPFVSEGQEKVGDIYPTATADLFKNGGSLSYSIQATTDDNKIKSLVETFIEPSIFEFSQYRHSRGIEAWVELRYEIDIDKGYFSIEGNAPSRWELIPDSAEIDPYEFSKSGGINEVIPETPDYMIDEFGLEPEEVDPEDYNTSNTDSVYIEQPGNYLLRLWIDDGIEGKTLNGNLNWKFAPFNDSEVKFKFTNLVIEGTEGETKEIEVTRTSEDLSNEETVKIKIATAPEGQELASYVFSNLSTLAGVGIERAKVKDLFLERISDGMVEEVADSAGEPKNSPNRKSTSTKLKHHLGKFISIADLLQSAYYQARATNSDIDPKNELSVTFAPGQDKATTSIKFEDDSDEEGDEFLFLKLSQNGKDLESSTAVAAIRDDDQTEMVNIGEDGLADIVIDGLVGALAGAVRGFIAGGGIGSAPGALIGGFVGGLSAAAITTLKEILEDVFQRKIVDSLVSIKNGDFDNLLNQTEPITGTDNSDNLNGGETSDSINAGNGNDTVNSGAGNDTVSGGEGDDTISGGNGSDLLEGGMGIDSLSGGEGSDIFGGSLEELNMDRIIDFSSEDVLLLQNTNFTQESLTVTQGSAILDIDTDLDGIIDSTITLEGDYADAEFLVEPVSIEGITETYITINDSTPRPEKGSGSIVDRFFNPDAGVHFYTADKNESDYVRENLDNYEYEGESYVTVDPVSGDNPEEVYRFFNSTTGVHLYTTDINERDYIIDNLSNFAYEDVKFHAYENEVSGSIPVHRFYEPTIGVHFYTPNEGEKVYVEENLFNYSYEGIAYYAFPVNDAEIL